MRRFVPLVTHMLLPCNFISYQLGLGLFASRGVKTIRGFAVGDKTFSTATLVSTIVATWIDYNAPDCIIEVNETTIPSYVDEDGEFVPLPPEFNPENLCSECFDAMDKKWRELEKPSDDFFQWPRDKDKTMDEIGWE